MPGNELEVCQFLFLHLNILELPHIGVVTQILAPLGTGEVANITSLDTLKISTSDSKKKADIYINGKGVSIKQKGASVLYNRIQRKNLENLYQQIGFDNITNKLHQIDFEVLRFHRGEIKRDRRWQDFFSIHEFKELLSYLMLHGSPNYGISQHPAEFILEAPASLISGTDIHLYSFDEYFDRYNERIYLSIRRSWIGQLSKSEHSRALSISKSLENQPWVFQEIITEPPKGWQKDIPEIQRRTVYYLMITKVGKECISVL